MGSIKWFLSCGPQQLAVAALVTRGTPINPLLHILGWAVVYIIYLIRILPPTVS